LELATALSQQRAINLDHDYPLANSPGPVAKFRLAVPLFSSRFSLASATQYRGPRQTTDGVTVPSVWLSDLTISSNRLPSNLEFQAGVRNIADRKYFDPVALDERFDTLPVPGRSMFVSLTWRKASQ
jgi:outer membrane receptor protein involved in Fe transport